MDGEKNTSGEPSRAKPLEEKSRDLTGEIKDYYRNWKENNGPHIPNTEAIGPLRYADAESIESARAAYDIEKQIANRPEGTSVEQAVTDIFKDMSSKDVRQLPDSFRAEMFSVLDSDANPISGVNNARLVLETGYTRSEMDAYIADPKVGDIDVRNSIGFSKEFFDWADQKRDDLAKAKNDMYKNNPELKDIRDRWKEGGPSAATAEEKFKLAGALVETHSKVYGYPAPSIEGAEPGSSRLLAAVYDGSTHIIHVGDGSMQDETLKSFEKTLFHESDHAFVTHALKHPDDYAKSPVMEVASQQAPYYTPIEGLKGSGHRAEMWQRYHMFPAERSAYLHDEGESPAVDRFNDGQRKNAEEKHNNTQQALDEWRKRHNPSAEEGSKQPNKISNEISPDVLAAINADGDTKPTHENLLNEVDIRISERPELTEAVYRWHTGDPVTAEEKGGVAAFVHEVHADMHGIAENMDVVETVLTDLEAAGDVGYIPLVNHTIALSDLAAGIEPDEQALTQSMEIQRAVETAIKNQDQGPAQYAVGERAMAGASTNSVLKNG